MRVCSASNSPPSVLHHGGSSKVHRKSLSLAEGLNLYSTAEENETLVVPFSFGNRTFLSFEDASRIIDKSSVRTTAVDQPKKIDDGETKTADDDDERELQCCCWNLADVWKWYKRLPWLVGMNYLPRTAVNFVEMWDETSFDPNTIDEELQWAANKLGYNTLRTNIPMVLYEHDKVGLTKRVNTFLRIAARNGFIVMLCPLDDCEFGGAPAEPGPQPDPVPGLHNSRAVGSPGRHIVLDPSQWWRVEEYVRYVVRTWGHDKRILLFDLYNEPGNPWIFKKDGTYCVDNLVQYERYALKLMEKVFQWAREEHPSQPLTTSAWHMPDPFCEGADSIIPLAHETDKRAMELSDVISIHAYCDPVILQSTLTGAASYGKPILMTEWMARQVKSTYDSVLPTLKELKVGAYQWGLVAGKSQTNLPWPHVACNFVGDPTWWHDVLDTNGGFHNEDEGEVIRTFVYPQNRAFPSEVLLLDDELSHGLRAGASQLLHQPSGNTASLHSATSVHHSATSMHHSAISMHHSATSMHHLQSGSNQQQLEGTADTTVILLPGEESVIPSVCSFSMAQINATAKAAAAEMSVAPSGMFSDQTEELEVGSPPTFGSQMASRTVEGLDLELYEGIEF